MRSSVLVSWIDLFQSLLFLPSLFHVFGAPVYIKKNRRSASKSEKRCCKVWSEMTNYDFTWWFLTGFIQLPSNGIFNIAVVVVIAIFTPPPLTRSSSSSSYYYKTVTQKHAVFSLLRSLLKRHKVFQNPLAPFNISTTGKHLCRRRCVRDGVSSFAWAFRARSPTMKWSVCA